jgi:type IV pilus assembly protein PilV
MMTKSRGFTLIEVLVAMLVLAVGLLGLAGLQATSLKNNLGTYHRSVATQLAYDMADRMRANFNEAKKLGANVYTSIAPSAAVTKASCLTKEANGCSSADMAQNDLYEWNQAINATTNPWGGLPQGAGTITISGNVLTVTVSWTENRYESGSNTSDTTFFQTSFQL